MPDPTLKPWSLQGGILYGPIRTRRYGLSLGVNLLPPNAKVCAFDCIYCQCGWTVEKDPAAWARMRHPSVSEVGAALEETLPALAREGKTPDSITLSGNGEPTLHPDFAAAIDAILAARGRFAPSARVVALSNGAGLARPGVREAMRRLDIRAMKLDAGDERTFDRINRPVVPADLDAYESDLRSIAPVIAQACFVTGSVDNASDACVGPWLERLARIRPAELHVYTLDRIPPDRGLRRVPRERLEAIAACARREAGVPARVF